MNKMRDIFDIDITIEDRSYKRYTLCIYRHLLYSKPLYEYGDPMYINDEYDEWYEIISHDESNTIELFYHIQNWIDSLVPPVNKKVYQSWDRKAGIVRLRLPHSMTGGYDGLIKEIGYVPTNIIDYNVRLYQNRDCRASRFDHIYLPCCDGDMAGFHSNVQIDLFKFFNKCSKECTWTSICENSVIHLVLDNNAQRYAIDRYDKFWAMIRNLIRSHCTGQWIGDPLLSIESDSIALKVTGCSQSSYRQSKYTLCPTRNSELTDILIHIIQFMNLTDGISLKPRNMTVSDPDNAHINIHLVAYKNHTFKMSIGWLSGMFGCKPDFVIARGNEAFYNLINKRKDNEPMKFIWNKFGHKTPITIDCLNEQKAKVAGLIATQLIENGIKEFYIDVGTEDCIMIKSAMFDHDVIKSLISKILI